MAGAQQGVVDADGHVVETAEDLAGFGWTGTSGNHGLDRVLSASDMGYRLDLARGARDPAQRLADMDREGIEVAVNYPTFLLMANQVDPEPAAALCEAYNRWFAATYRAADADRLRAPALVSLANPERAVHEARRAVIELGAVGIVVSPYCQSVHLGDRALDPLWGLAQELGVPVAIHGGRGTTAPHLSTDSFPHQDQRTYYAMAHPFGQMMAMGDLVFGGVMERYPGVRFAFLEAGIGWIPWYVDRLDQAHESLDPPAGLDPLPRAPSEYLLGGSCYFSCEPDEVNLSPMIDAVGEDQVLFASDYPHFDCKHPDAVTTIAATAALSERAMTKITATNAARLYRL